MEVAMLFVCKLLFVGLTSLTVVPQQEPLGEYWGTAEEEQKYYKLVDIPLPKDLAVEAGSFEVMPDQKRLAVATRRGDIFLVDGAFEEFPEPKFSKFASGLDEVFGMAYRDNAFFITQQTEVSRVSDENGDGRADRFDTLSDRWGFRHYHEFAFGSKPDHEGNIWVALCLSKSYHSDAPFRGWCLKITPDGKTIPVCSGIRSPCGIGPNEHGVMFYAESQGPWNGSCSLKVLQPGGFMGHPVSFNWYELAPEMGPPPVKPNTPSRLETERKRVKELVPYAVVFPYKRMGRSISGFMVDKTGGKFGPFQDQIFIGDFSLGVIMRATTEKVNGVWQGACYPFREGFDTGLLAVQFTPEGQLIAGGTNRGWPVRGPKAFAVQRLDWTGKTPFEIKEIRVTPRGFNLNFTKPVDRSIAAQLSTYQFKTFTHIYRQGYGSPEVDQTEPKAKEVFVSPDGHQVEVVVPDRVQGHVHEFFLPNLKSATGERLLHTSAYYTLNEIPKEKTTASTPENHSTCGFIDFKRPSDAVQLVGKDRSIMVPATDAKCQWEFQDGVLTASPKWDSVKSPDAYRDFRLHLEFNVNDRGDVERGTNGNSGVYLQQRYELQILNSFGTSMADYRGDDCGCIYRLKKPDQLVNKPAGEWQSFDIAFRAARFDGTQKTKNARVTVYQNGQLIHDDVELPRKTGAGKREGPWPRPILLQGHHNQVKFRNVWVHSLEDENTQENTLGTQEKTPLLKHPVPESDLWLTYRGGDGPGKGKHIVLIAADQEYRSEQSMPMLAEILSKQHGFHCTVLFCVNEHGLVDPTLEAPFKEREKRHRIPGLKYLKTADGVIWLSRFMQLKDQDKQHFHEYFDSGKPLLALRTANHGFWGGPPYRVNGQPVSLRKLLGGTFMGHHGGWHREATRGVVFKANRRHPILRGVKDVFGPSDVYRCHNEKNPFPDDCTLLLLGQPLVDLKPDSPPNKEKEPLPIAWVKEFDRKSFKEAKPEALEAKLPNTQSHDDQAKSSRIFHFTMGSARDFESEGVRRITLNALYWGLGMEQWIESDLPVDLPEGYKPRKSGFGYEKLGVKPEPASNFRLNENLPSP